MTYCRCIDRSEQENASPMLSARSLVYITLLHLPQLLSAVNKGAYLCIKAPCCKTLVYQQGALLLGRLKCAHVPATLFFLYSSPCPDDTLLRARDSRPAEVAAGMLSANNRGDADKVGRDT